MTNDPVLIAYSALKGEGRKRPFWKRIGKAYPHESGVGLTVVLDLMPLDGRIILIEPGSDDDERLLREAQRFKKSRAVRKGPV